MTLDRGWDTVVVAASGPSLDQQQADLVREAQAAGRCRVIVVNTTYQLLPFADVLFAADRMWWKIHEAEVMEHFQGERWRIEQRGLQRHPPRARPRRPYKAAERRVAVDDRFHRVRVMRGKLISDTPGAICMGGNSGFAAATGLAPLFGGRRIILVGFDMQRTAGKQHWHGDHPTPLHSGDPTGWIPNFVRVAPELKRRGLDVINASKATALKCFPRLTLEQAFQ